MSFLSLFIQSQISLGRNPCLLLKLISTIKMVSSLCTTFFILLYQFCMLIFVYRIQHVGAYLAQSRAVSKIPANALTHHAPPQPNLPVGFGKLFEPIGRIGRAGGRHAVMKLSHRASLRLPCDPVRQLHNSDHLPMQKSRKITSKTSSTSTRPVRRPRSRAAKRSSSAMMSSRSGGSPSARPRA